MAKKVRVTYYGMEGEGRTLTEAKADAGRKAERAISGTYTPLLISARGQSALVYRIPASGWWYTILRPEREQKQSLYGTNSSEDRDWTERRARMHLAQNIFEFDGPTGLEVVKNRQDRKEHLSYLRFQYCYRAWREAGESNDNLCHERACYDKWPDGVEPWTWDGQS
jgi:hypothetical protein